MPAVHFLVLIIFSGAGGGAAAFSLPSAPSPSATQRPCASNWVLLGGACVACEPGFWAPAGFATACSPCDGQHCPVQVEDYVDVPLAGGVMGWADGPGSRARFQMPKALAWHGSSGYLVVAETWNARVRRVHPRSGLTSTLAGDGESRFLDGPALAASFVNPSVLATSAISEDVYIGDGEVALSAVTGAASDAAAGSFFFIRRLRAGNVSTIPCRLLTAKRTGLAGGTDLQLAVDSLERLVVVQREGVYVIDVDSGASRLFLATPLGAPAVAGLATWGPYLHLLFSNGTLASLSTRNGSVLANAPAPPYPPPASSLLVCGTPLITDSAGRLFLFSTSLIYAFGPQPLPSNYSLLLSSANTMQGLAVDAARRFVYTSGSGSSSPLRTFTAEALLFSTVAGSELLSTDQDGAGTAAGFNTPTALAALGASKLLVLTTGYNGPASVRAISLPSAQVSTVSTSPPVRSSNGLALTLFLAVDINWVAHSVDPASGARHYFAASASTSAADLAAAPSTFALQDSALGVAASAGGSIFYLTVAGIASFQPPSYTASALTPLPGWQTAAAWDISSLGKFVAGGSGAFYFSQQRAVYRAAAWGEGGMAVAPLAGGGFGAANGGGNSALFRFTDESGRWMASPDLVTVGGVLYFTDPANNLVRALTRAPCPVSTYCPNRLTVLSCPGGSFGDSLGEVASSCAGQCSGGHFCPPASTVPTQNLCAAGQHCPPGSSAPLPCPPGSSMSMPGFEECQLCAPGTLASAPGSKLCIEYCPRGSFRKDFGGVNASADCMPCPPGSYSEVLGSTACTPCPSGSFSAEPGASSAAACRPCALGSAAPAAGASACSQCPAGLWSADGISCFQFTCPTLQQPRSYAPPASLADCAPLQCQPPLLLLQDSCQGCPAGTAGTLAAQPNASLAMLAAACSACSAREVCPGGTSRPLWNFNSSSSATSTDGSRRGVAADAAAAAVPLTPFSACPRLTAAAPAAPSGILASASAFFLAGASVGGMLLLFLLVRSAASLLPHYSARLQALMMRLDMYGLKEPEEVGRHPTYNPTFEGGIATLLGLTSLTIYASYLVYAWFTSNVLQQQSLAFLSSSTIASLDNLPWASASLPSLASPASGLLLRLTLDGNPARCAAPLAPPVSSGLDRGAWALLKSTADCGDTGVSQLTYACQNCIVTQESQLTLLLDRSCQSMLLESAAVPADPPNSLQVFSLKAADTALSPAGPLAALSWKISLAFSTRLDVSGAQAKGYNIFATSVTALRSAPLLATAAASAAPNASASAALVPLAPGTAIQLTVTLSLAETFITTTYVQITSWTTLISNIAGLAGFLGVFGVLLKVWKKGEVSVVKPLLRGKVQPEGAADAAAALQPSAGEAVGVEAYASSGAGLEQVAGPNAAAKAVQPRYPLLAPELYDVM